MSGQQSRPTPHSEQHADCHQKDHPARSILGVLNSLRRLTSSMFPPCEAVANEESETEGQDQFREQVLDVEEIAHTGDGR